MGTIKSRNPAQQARLWLAIAGAALLAACGGSGGSDSITNSAGESAATDGSAQAGAGTSSSALAAAASLTATGTADAVRLAHQASFGPSEALISDIRRLGAVGWVGAQVASKASSYRSGGAGDVHQQTSDVSYCDQLRRDSETCWRDNFSADPLLWDFYRNAMQQPDQLRQRVAFALQQIVVVSSREVSGTYGLRNYHNRLLDLAFGNYRDVLRSVALSPVMGDYLNNVNNSRTAPNENFARELLQLFAIGTCELGADGQVAGGTCKATYNNETVRAYAYALTGWTYPVGGATSWGCWPRGTNCRYYDGDMVPAPSLRDTETRRLLQGISVPAASTAELALERVLDSLMLHPNMAPFISRQLIQHLVSANPSNAYVQRVSAAFTSGRHATDVRSFGTGQRGDLEATVAAILLDDEARTSTLRAESGRLREPALMFTGVLRALNGQTDGAALNWYWGGSMAQRVFSPPSVFNFYPPDYPVAGTKLVGPTFGINNTNTAVARLNFLTYLLYWNGSEPEKNIPGAVGTRADLTAFEADAADAAKLVDRLSALAYGVALPAAQRQTVVDAVSSIKVGGTDDAKAKTERVQQAAYLIFASPRWHVLR